MTATATAASTSTTTSTTTITSTPPSPLQHATTNSTIAWQTDLEALFHRSQDRFPDVVWALLTEEDGEPTGEQVYGHKGGSATSISSSCLRIPLTVSSSQPLLVHPHTSLLLLPVLYRFVPLYSLLRSLTYTRLQPSFTLVLPQASRHGIFPSALPLFYPQCPWIHFLHRGFPPSPLSLFPLVQKYPPYLDPLRPFALHPPPLKIKMA